YFGGSMPLNVVTERKDRICQRVLDEVRIIHPEANVRLSVAGNVEGRWDPDRVAQAIGNLIINAVEHAEGDVVVDVIGGADDVTVTVTNPGAFPEALREALYLPFRKGDRGSRGVGLGLFIVRESVSAHGGRSGLARDD